MVMKHKTTLAFGGLLLLISSPSLAGSTVLQQILHDHPTIAITTCPLLISGGGGSTVLCIKVQGQTAGQCTSCTNTSSATITAGSSYTLPGNGTTINYSLDAINSTGAQYCRLGACGGSATIQITLYSDAGCSAQVCTTSCPSSAGTCASGNSYGGCPASTLTCS